MDWRLIDSAPRDGSRFLAYNPVVGQYTTAALMINGKIKFPCGNWPTGRVNDSGLGKWYCSPTHWRELPDPPND